MASHPTPGESSTLLMRKRENKLSKPSTISKSRRIVWAILTVAFVGGLVLFIRFQDLLAKIHPLFGLPKDPLDAALAILDKAPVIVSKSSSSLQR